MTNTYELNYEDCMKINAAIKKNIKSDDPGIAVAIVDSHGELLSFFRTDNCPPSAIRIAQNKAFTAVRDRQSSASLKENSLKYNFSITELGDSRFTGLGGGIPVIHEGRYIGAVAVSGMAQEEDEALATSGIEALYTYSDS